MQNTKNIKDCSVIILAAGKSERMGSPKLKLSYNDSQTFIEHIVDEYYKFGCKEIVIVVNEENMEFLKDDNLKLTSNIKIVLNKHPEWHRFYSLKTGAMDLEKIQPVFVHNVDNPFVNHQVLNELLNSSKQIDYISPEFEGKGGHPFLISDKIVNDLKNLQIDQMHLKEFLNQYSRLKIKVNYEKILVNINNLDEYHAIFK